MYEYLVVWTPDNGKTILDDALYADSVKEAIKMVRFGKSEDITFINIMRIDGTEI